MDPTSLPTDNLYKFLALGGLALAGFSAWLWWKIVEFTERARLGFRTESVELKARLAAMGDMNERLAKQNQNFSAGAEEATNTETNHFYADLLVRTNLELKELGANIHADSRALATLEERISAFQASLKFYQRAKRALGVGVVVGAVMSVAGFVLWYARLQVFLDQATADAAREQAAKAASAELELEHTREPHRRRRHR